MLFVAEWKEQPGGYNKYIYLEGNMKGPTAELTGEKQIMEDGPKIYCMRLKSTSQGESCRYEVTSKTLY
jgi:hypothetical protein